MSWIWDWINYLPKTVAHDQDHPRRGWRVILNSIFWWIWEPTNSSFIHSQPVSIHSHHLNRSSLGHHSFIDLTRPFGYKTIIDLNPRSDGRLDLTHHSTSLFTFTPSSIWFRYTSTHQKPIIYRFYSLFISQTSSSWFKWSIYVCLHLNLFIHFSEHWLKAFF